jgi:plastocyanin
MTGPATRGRLGAGFALLWSGAVIASAVSPPAGKQTATLVGTVGGKGIASRAAVVVSLEAPGLVVQPPSIPVPMDQKGFEFVPRFLPVRSGTTVRFQNGDPEPHNVYSPEGRYDLGTWRRGETRDHRFEAPGVYTQRCSIHPEMLAFVVVLATPYFAVPDPEGRFSIRDIVPGKYRLVVTSPRQSEVEREVSLEDGKTLSVQLVVSR